jgi:hypothetical protein
VSYLDAAPWPGTPDGTGPSLELVDLLSDNSLPENWLASTVTGGTPRAVNSVNAAPKITQVLATPARPDPNQPVVVSAKLPVGSTAQLTYKIMFAADVVIPFLDDAAAPVVPVTACSPRRSRPDRRAADPVPHRRVVQQLRSPTRWSATRFATAASW